MFTCSWRGVWKMFKYFFILAFDFFSEYDLSTSHSLNNNFMTTSKVIDFNNKIGSDGIQLSEFQVFKIKKTIVIKKKFFCNVYPF